MKESWYFTLVYGYIFLGIFIGGLVPAAIMAMSQANLLYVKSLRKEPLIAGLIVGIVSAYG
jgi:hypothetical protein